jgi:hypothetical protein
MFNYNACINKPSTLEIVFQESHWCDRLAGELLNNKRGKP